MPLVMHELTEAEINNYLEKGCLAPVDLDYLAGKVVPKDSDLIEMVKSFLWALDQCPCPNHGVYFNNTPEERQHGGDHAVLELLPIGDGKVKLHICCEVCVNDQYD